jgi:hypothetical protein
LNGDSSTLAGWTVTDDGIGFASFVLYSMRDDTHSGSYAVTLNQGAGLSTAVSLLAGQDYRLAAWLQNAALNFPPAPLDVAVGGIGTTWSLPLHNAPYRLMTFDFTATTTDAAAVLRLFNASSVGDFKAYTLDDESIAAVPEPGPWALLMAGLCALRLAVKRRSSKV